MTTPAKTITLKQARHAWFDAQFAGGELARVPGGWTRALGGVDPYLALRARVPDVRRPDVDALYEQGELWVVPGVRNCIWVVPKTDVGLALAVSWTQSERRITREMGKIGVEQQELDDLGSAIVELLADGALTPNELRDQLPEGSWRSLGDVGKKLGHTTNLPMALRMLEWQGRLRRRQVDGRLDSQGYAWELLDFSALELGHAPTDPLHQAVLLTRRFFEWAGLETLEAFVQWSSCGKRDARKAFAALELAPVQIDDREEPYYCLPEFVDALGTDRERGVALVTAQDNLLSLRGQVHDLAAPAHHDFELQGIGGRKVRVSDARWMNQRAIIHDGEWVGLWEWDESRNYIQLGGFDRLPPQAREVADALTPFIADDLDGIARANSIDGESARAKRLAAVQAM